MTTPSSHDVSEIEFGLSTTALFSSLGREQSRQLASSALVFEYEAGSTCMLQGEPTLPAFYVILAGQAFLHRQGEAKVVLFSGTRFGQELLQPGESVVAPFTIQAKSRVRYARITYADMKLVFDVDRVDKGASVDKVFRRKVKTAPRSDIQETSPQSPRTSNTMDVPVAAIAKSIARNSPKRSPKHSPKKSGKLLLKSATPTDSSPAVPNSSKTRTHNVTVTQNTTSNEKEELALRLQPPLTTDDDTHKSSKPIAISEKLAEFGDSSQKDRNKDRMEPRASAAVKATPPASPTGGQSKPKALLVSPRAVTKPKTVPLPISPRKPKDSHWVEEPELSLEEAVSTKSPVGRKVGKLGKESFSFLNDSQNVASRHTPAGKLTGESTAVVKSQDSFHDSIVLISDDSLQDSKTRFEQSLSKFENSIRSTSSAGSGARLDATSLPRQLNRGIRRGGSNRSLHQEDSRAMSSSHHRRRGLASSDSIRSLGSAEAKEFRRRLRITAKGLQGKESLHSEVIEEDRDKESVPAELSVSDFEENHASGMPFHESESSFHDSNTSFSDSRSRFEESLSKFQADPTESSNLPSTVIESEPPAQSHETNEITDAQPQFDESVPPTQKSKSKAKKGETKRAKGNKKNRDSDPQESYAKNTIGKADKRKKKKRVKDKSKDTVSSLLGALNEAEATDVVTEITSSGKKFTRERGVMRYPSSDTIESWTSYKGRYRQYRDKFEEPIRPRPPPNVAQKPIKLPPDFQPPTFKKSKEDERQISKALSTCFAFKAMPHRNLKALIAAFEPQQAQAGTEIIGKGTKEDCFYVVKEGEVEVKVDGQNAGTVSANQTFGDSNLFDVSSNHKDVTATATRQTSLFKVNHTTYRSILQIQSMALHERKKQLLEKLPLLERTPKEYLSKMADVMKPVSFAKGDAIDTQVDGKKRLYILDEGRVKCKNEAKDDVLQSGGVLGEHAFVGDIDEPQPFEALSDVAAFYIDLEAFEKVIGPVNRVIIPKAKEEAQMELRSVVMDTKLLRFDPKKPLTVLERNSILAIIEDRTYQKGDVILEANEAVPACLFFIKRGMIEAYDMSTCQTSMTFVMGPNIVGKQIFRAAKVADNAIVSGSIRLVASDQVVVGVLPAADYLETRAFYLQKPIHNGWHPGKSYDSDDSDFDSDSDEEYADYLEEDDYGRVQRENLVKKTLLGEGGFGQVWLVYDKTEKRPMAYAYKVQSKYELTVAGDADVAVREKKIMRDLRHPNVIRLLASYQDENFIYFLMNLIQGGELYSILHPIDEDVDNPVGLGETKARFYAFGIADALAYLHRKGYVYRDLKPENVLIDNHGHPILCDFGLAKRLQPQEKTFTMRGTPGYLSPESVLNIGHTYSADHWSLGILICELICGESPFFFFGIDSVELYRRITEDPFYPPECASDDAVDLMGGLLTKDPAVRLGSLTGGEADIIKHKWFTGLDPTAMRRRKVEAPWKPLVKDPFDASNFEDWGDLEDKTLQNFPSLSRKEAAVFDEF